MAVPDVSHLPLPAPADELRMLYLAAYLLYVVPMNLAIGFPLLTLMAEAIGHGQGDTTLRRVATWLARRTPGVVVLALVGGLPPYLLGIALHGDAALPAVRQMSWFWLALVPLCFVACGASFWVALRRRGTEPSTLRPFLPDIVESYLLAFRRRGLERPGLVLTIAAAAALLAIGFIFVAHAVLVGRPDLWGPSAGPGNGIRLPLKDPQLLPRLLHTLFGALALSGFAVAWHGADRVADGESAYGRTALRFGVLWFAVVTGLQLLAGPWYLFSMRPEIVRVFLGGVTAPTIWLWSGAGAGIVAVLLAVVALAAPEPRQYIRGAAAVLLYAVGAMTVVRLDARDAVLAALAPHAVRAGAAAQTGMPGVPAAAGEAGALTLAVVTAAAAAAAIGYMLWAAAAGRRRSG